METNNSIASVLGHFHPLLVHLPIGAVIVLATLELIARLTQWKEAARSAPWILVFICGSAVASAVCGWMLAEHYECDSPLITWHRAFALAFVTLCLLTAFLKRINQTRAYRASLFITVMTLLVVGDLGASIAHGQNFFITRSILHLRQNTAAPEPQTNTPPGHTPEQAIFASVAKPVLASRCVNCHGPDRHKAGLRLDSMDALLRGGLDGEVVEPGNANASLLIHRLLLPVNADGHMPPEDQAQPTVEEIKVLKWWINSGMSLTNR